MTDFFNKIFILENFSYILSILTLYFNYNIGNLNKKIWIYGIILELIWIAWVYSMKLYGLLILSFFMIIIYIRNHFKWSTIK